MTRRTCWIDKDQQGVAVAVEAKGDDGLGVAAGVAFVPELLTAAAPKDSLPDFECAAQALFVHPCHHQHLLRLCILDDGGDQPGRVKFK